MDEGEEHAGVGFDRPHERQQDRRSGRRHRGLLHFDAPRGRTHRHGRSEHLLPEHHGRRTVQPKPGSARQAVHRTGQNRPSAADARQNAVEQDVARIQGSAGRARRAQRAGTVDRQSAEGPHRHVHSARLGGRTVRLAMLRGQQRTHQAGLPRVWGPVRNRRHRWRLHPAAGV